MGPWRASGLLEKDKDRISPQAHGGDSLSEVQGKGVGEVVTFVDVHLSRTMYSLHYPLLKTLDPGQVSHLEDPKPLLLLLQAKGGSRSLLWSSVTQGKRNLGN